ncbi:putative calcium-binding protein CML48 [Silene latifolia]|uniref:putative calcium-binding protein CML48 n=1 Tax=Silene latifolia TaxID=37657 RepID=UPI003D77762F
MSYFKPSAPPIPTSSSSSSNPNYNCNQCDNHTNNYNYPNYPSTNYPPPGGYNSFPAGTDPEIIRVFESVDRDRSGFVEDYELQNALSFGYHKFNLRTVRLLISLFKNPNQSYSKIGPGEFAALWRCLGEWRVIFEKFDRDRCGKIDVGELKDALYSLGYAVPPSVLQLLISYYNGGSRGKVLLDFDSFVECGTIIKGLTEKFKEKDKQYTGSATIAYDDFMALVLPFVVTYD